MLFTVTQFCVVTAIISGGCAYSCVLILNNGSLKLTCVYCTSNNCSSLYSLVHCYECVTFSTQAYLWHNNEAAVEWIESQMSSSAQSTLTQNLECIRKDRVLRQVQAYVSHIITFILQCTSYLHLLDIFVYCFS